MQCRKIKLVVCAFLGINAFILSGCGSTAEVNFERYTLTQTVSPKAYDADYSVKLDMAPILLQGGIVIQVSEVALRPAKNYRYSANLNNELRILAIDEMLRNDVSNKYAADIYVSKFQGTLDGKVLVSANVRFLNKDTEKTLYSKPFAVETSLDSDGYDALVLELKHNYLNIIDEAINEFKQSLNTKVKTSLATASSKAKSSKAKAK